MKKTKDLARELGLLRKRCMPSTFGAQAEQAKAKQLKKCTGQLFSYLIVLDFESTCWQDGKCCPQEIIEFPAVLCNTTTGEIENEFHYYVQPQEQPMLSDFCKQLTGISQEQVDQGIPLSLCLRKFSHWLTKLKQQKNLVFSAVKDGDGAKTTFVTWSDWDLGVCLLYEARRKQLTKPAEMSSWIDLRATYRKFYGRKPHGLNGALQDVGIEFEGRQHSGVDDARNTARLAWRMMRDGCVMNTTKNILSETTSNMVQTSEKKKPSLGKATSTFEIFKDNDGHQTKKLEITALRQTKLQMYENKNSPSVSKVSGGLQVRDSNVSRIRVDCEDGVKIPSVSGDKISTDCVTPSCKMSAQTKASADKVKAERKENSNPSFNTCIAGEKNKVSLKTSSIEYGGVFKTPKQNLVQTSVSGFGNPQSCRRQNEKSVSVNTPVTPASSMRATPPMCKCGRRCKRRLVQSPGPNMGRFFFTCGVRTSQYDKNRGCDFFKWEAALSGASLNRVVSKTGNLTQPFTPVLNLNRSLQSRKQLGVRSAVPKFIR